MRVIKSTLRHTTIIAFFSFLQIINQSINALTIAADSVRLRQHVAVLTKTIKPRNYQNSDMLDTIAGYIKREFISYGYDHVAEQSYLVKDTIYRNVIASVGPSDAARIVIGAHYDVYGETPGADDNASGVAGLLETARVLFQMKDSLKYRLNLSFTVLKNLRFSEQDSWGAMCTHQASPTTLLKSSL